MGADQVSANPAVRPYASATRLRPTVNACPLLPLTTAVCYNGAAGGMPTSSLQAIIR